MPTRDHAKHAPDHRQARGSIWLLVFGAFVLIGAFFVLQEHRAHVLGALPYLLGFAALFFCMFGHGHGARDHRGEDRGEDRGENR